MGDQLLLRKEEQTVREGQKAHVKEEDDGDLATIDRDSEKSEPASPVKVGSLI